MREIGVHNLDHRVQQVDFKDQDNQTTTPKSSLTYADIENQNSILLVGCNIDREVPLAGVRLRKAFRNGAKVYAINPVDFEYRFDLTERFIISL